MMARPILPPAPLTAILIMLAAPWNAIPVDTGMAAMIPKARPGV
jgi:hypothetical protein